MTTIETSHLSLEINDFEDNVTTTTEDEEENPQENIKISKENFQKPQADINSNKSTACTDSEASDNKKQISQVQQKVQNVDFLELPFSESTPEEVAIQVLSDYQLALRLQEELQGGASSQNIKNSNNTIAQPKNEKGFQAKKQDYQVKQIKKSLPKDKKEGKFQTKQSQQKNNQKIKEASTTATTKTTPHTLLQQQKENIKNSHAQKNDKSDPIPSIERIQTETILPILPDPFEDGTPQNSHPSTEAEIQSPTSNGPQLTKKRIIFIRKTLILLAIQQAISTILVSMSLVIKDQYNSFILDNMQLAILSIWVGFIIICILVCKRDFLRKGYNGLIAYIIFTASLSYSLGVIASLTEGDVLFAATVLTVACVIAVSIYAYKTKDNITPSGPVNVLVPLIVIVFLIMTIIHPAKFLYLFGGACIAVCFTIYLVHDIKSIINNVDKKYQDGDHYLAAIDIYVDIYTIFTQIIKFLSSLF